MPISQEPQSLCSERGCPPGNKKARVVAIFVDRQGQACFLSSVVGRFIAIRWVVAAPRK
jgi:hypothetical protein